MVAAFADEGSTIVFAGAAVLVVLVVAPQDFPHKWSYVLVVPNDLKNLSIAAGAASEMMLRDIDFKVQAVENIMHGNVEMQLLLHHFMASLCENIIVRIIFDTLGVKSYRVEVNGCRLIAITAGLCLARKVISWVVYGSCCTGGRKAVNIWAGTCAAPWTG